MKSLLASFVLSGLLHTGCESLTTHDSAPSVFDDPIFGNGEAVLEYTFNAALSDYDLLFEDFGWSYAATDDEFSCTDNVIVRNAVAGKVADKLELAVERLPEEFGWGSSWAAGKMGDQLVDMSYVDDDGLFYIDLLLFQIEEDVEVLILYKGIRHRSR